MSRLRTLLENLLGKEGITEADRGFLHAESGTAIDAVADSAPPIDDFAPFGNLKTASVKDIAAHKASALCLRDELKDYLDIAFLTLNQGWTLKNLEELAEQKFRLGTISEEKLLAELIAKRDAFTVPDDIFLRAPQENRAVVEQQVAHLLKQSAI